MCFNAQAPGSHGGHTLSCILGGSGVGFFLKLNPAISGFAIAIIGALVIEQLRRVYRTYTEVPVAIIMTSGLALSVVLMSLNQNLSKSFSSYLFGSIVAVSDTQLRLIAVVAAVGIIFLLVCAGRFITLLLMRKPLRYPECVYLSCRFYSPCLRNDGCCRHAGSRRAVGFGVNCAAGLNRAADGNRFLAAMGIAVVVGLSGVFRALLLHTISIRRQEVPLP